MPGIELSKPPTSTAPSAGPPRRKLRVVGRATFVLSCLAVPLVAATPYLTRSLADLAAGNAGLAAHYVHQPVAIRTALLVHAASGGLALLLAPLQWWAGLRRSRPVVHRAVGRLSVGTILVAAVSGLAIAQVSYAGLVGTLGFSALALLWGFAAVRTALAAAGRRLAEHRAWALRTTALTLAAVTLRAWLGVLIAVQRPDSAVALRDAFDQAYAVVPFLCWVPNLLLAEWLIRRRRRITT